LRAEDGTKALGLACQEKADLVLTSIDLPGMNGIDLIAHLRQLRAYRTTPIMMLATEAESGKKIAGRRVGATGWIGKPFDRQRFLAIVRQVCPID
jgi:two-component system, chemotaxis family, chemotaxis protein CheY